MQVLVTGGAGYIGSHTAKALARAGFEPIVLDNLSRGHRAAVRWGPFVELDLANRGELRALFQKYRIGAVIHFAAFIAVGESMYAPADYFRNNVVNTMNLLDAMGEAGVQRIVFSSTAAVYGNPLQSLMAEEHPTLPVNPYGESKLMVERLLGWYGKAYGLEWTALRYFNAAGADAEGEAGEMHHPETHLIPLAVAAAHGDLPELKVFGSDYDTADGTAIRDYIHVSDLATAHLKALERLARGGSSLALNLGTGQGHSVHEVIAAVQRAGGRTVPVRHCPRRAGDAAVLVADASRAHRELGFRPQHSSLDAIVQSAWQWYSLNFDRMPVVQGASEQSL
ncbi:MAG: UDP-glucose 4-epimerase GalE [Acidobacteriia bacterium]|nr:UDP-glucose 4-epimerase GalE [Terriglobia bacterium]